MLKLILVRLKLRLCARAALARTKKKRSLRNGKLKASRASATVSKLTLQSHGMDGQSIVHDISLLKTHGGSSRDLGSWIELR